MGQVIGKPQAHELAADKQAGGQATALLLACPDLRPPG